VLIFFQNEKCFLSQLTFIFQVWLGYRTIYKITQATFEIAVTGYFQNMLIVSCLYWLQTMSTAFKNFTIFGLIDIC